MLTQSLEIKASIQIQKTVHDVFEAIVDPVKMSNYFISYGSGRMEENAELIWQFPEFDMKVPIRVGKIEQDKFISFSWDGEDGNPLLVAINLTSIKTNDTLINITEQSRANDEAGIRWLKGNTEGWANFLACLKAWLDHGINLRKGAFEFLKKDGCTSD